MISPNNLTSETTYDKENESSEDLFFDLDEASLEPTRYEHYRFVADKKQGLLRVDKFLVDRIEGISRNRIQQAADSDCIYVNGKQVKSNYKVKPCDIVTVEMEWERRELEIIPQQIDLNIVYEDDDLLVINKPAGLVVHPGHGNYSGTLVNGLAYHLKQENCESSDDPRLGLVHRIDKDTSGLILVAKNMHAKSFLSAQFFNKTVKREYNALVWGIVKEDKGVVEGDIARDVRNRLRMCVVPENTGGKHAVTHYEVLERLGYVTLVRCVLETGRTHQIRVHMKHIGHPVFNDERYGGDEILKGTQFTKYKQFVKNCFLTAPRQFLHAKTLGFIHPTTKEEMFFSSELSEELTLVLEKWRSYLGNRNLEDLK